jgi:hypothetical protein
MRSQLRQETEKKVLEKKKLLMMKEMGNTIKKNNELSDNKPIEESEIKVKIAENDLSKVNVKNQIKDGNNELTPISKPIEATDIQVKIAVNKVEDGNNELPINKTIESADIKVKISENDLLASKSGIDNFKGEYMDIVEKQLKVQEIETKDQMKVSLDVTIAPPFDKVEINPIDALLDSKNILHTPLNAEGNSITPLIKPNRTLSAVLNETEIINSAVSERICTVPSDQKGKQPKSIESNLNIDHNTLSHDKMDLENVGNVKIVWSPKKYDEPPAFINSEVYFDEQLQKDIENTQRRIMEDRVKNICKSADMLAERIDKISRNNDSNNQYEAVQETVNHIKNIVASLPVGKVEDTIPIVDEAVGVDSLKKFNEKLKIAQRRNDAALVIQAFYKKHRSSQFGLKSLKKVQNISKIDILPANVLYEVVSRSPSPVSPKKMTAFSLRSNLDEVPLSATHISEIENRVATQSTIVEKKIGAEDKNEISNDEKIKKHLDEELMKHKSLFGLVNFDNDMLQHHVVSEQFNYTKSGSYPIKGFECAKKEQEPDESSMINLFMQRLSRKGHSNKELQNSNMSHRSEGGDRKGELIATDPAMKTCIEVQKCESNRVERIISPAIESINQLELEIEKYLNAQMLDAQKNVVVNLEPIPDISKPVQCSVVVDVESIKIDQENKNNDKQTNQTINPIVDTEFTTVTPSGLNLNHKGNTELLDNDPIVSVNGNSPERSEPTSRVLNHEKNIEEIVESQEKNIEEIVDGESIDTNSDSTSSFFPPSPPPKSRRILAKMRKTRRNLMGLDGMDKLEPSSLSRTYYLI